MNRTASTTRTDTQRIPKHVGAADSCSACRAEFGGPVEPEHSLLRLDDDPLAVGCGLLLAAVVVAQ